jgi:hypothetical protein
MKALILEAQQITNKGFGGGVVSLLLPTSPKDEDQLAKIKEIYTVDKVKARPGNKSGQSDRKALKAALANDELIAKLISLYGEYIRSEPGPQRGSVNAVTNWLQRELENPDGRAYGVVLSLAPVLVEAKRSDRWWESAFAKRRKTQS